MSIVVKKRFWIAPRVARLLLTVDKAESTVSSASVAPATVLMSTLATEDKVLPLLAAVKKVVPVLVASEKLAEELNVTLPPTVRTALVPATANVVVVAFPP